MGSEFIAPAQRELAINDAVKTLTREIEAAHQIHLEVEIRLKRVMSPPELEPEEEPGQLLQSGVELADDLFNLADLVRQLNRWTEITLRRLEL